MYSRRKLLRALLLSASMVVPAKAQFDFNAFNTSEKNAGNPGFSGAGISALFYYVDAVSGNDGNDGLSPATAWRTMAKVQGFVYPAGWIFIAFKGGVTNSAAVGLSWNRSKTVITSYGGGRAQLHCTDVSGSGTTLYAHDCDDFIVNNINISSENGNFAAFCVYISASTQNCNRWQITNCDFTGGGNSCGLLIGGDSATTYFDNLLIQDVNIFNSTFGSGIISYNFGAGFPQHRNIIARRVVTHDCGKSGIALGNCLNSLVEYSSAYNCGAVDAGGPIGIWYYGSTNCIIQYCESYNNTSIGSDGGGFDLDGDCNGCTVQFCYAHDNKGAGCLIWGYNTGVSNNNIIRFNVFQNNGIDPFYSEITVGRSGSGTVSNTFIYGNTCYNARGATRSVINITDASCTGKIYNNIFYAGGVSKIMTVIGNPAFTFAGNDYYTAGSYSFVWNGVTYASLAAWQAATNQEKLGGVNVGLIANPLLTSPGGGGTIGAGNNSALTAYKLASGSPMYRAGLNLQTLFSLNPGPLDFYSNALNSASLSVGAHCPTASP